MNMWLYINIIEKRPKEDRIVYPLFTLLFRLLALTIFNISFLIGSFGLSLYNAI